jgi:hypothetical protein
MTAAKHLGARRNVPWLISRRAVLADEAISPSGTPKVICARGFIWKQALKLRQRVGEQKFFSLKYVDSHDRSRLTIMPNILPLVGGCDNPISTGYGLLPWWLFCCASFKAGTYKKTE